MMVFEPEESLLNRALQGAHLLSAHVGISFGEASAIAKDSSDVIILGKDQLKKVELAITNANQTLTTIKQNLFWALSYNLLAIPIAGLGLLSPIIAAGSMAFSDLIVIGNSIRLKFKSDFTNTIKI